MTGHSIPGIAADIRACELLQSLHLDHKGWCAQMSCMLSHKRNVQA